MRRSLSASRDQSGTNGMMRETQSQDQALEIEALILRYVL
jgi:hypothetical protein